MNKSKLISGLSLIICLFALIQTKAADFYWVGGSGNWSDISHWRTTSGGATYPSVVPGSSDNVYFDANSGFTTTSKTVTLNVTGNCHNITFAGSSVAPALTESGLQTLNIYGSSVWQSGMPAINISYIYYRNTGEAKTITSNGVKTGNRNVYLEETNSISLSDAFSVELFLYHQAGTFRTNGHDLTIGYSFEVSLTSSPKTIILGSSQVYMTATGARFNTNQANITLNAGTSHIHFPNMSSFQSSEGILPYQGQTFYNVSFENSNGGGSLGGNQTGTVYFNRVEFKGNGNIYQNNEFKELVFAPTKTYQLSSGKTQTITSLLSASTPQCGGWSTIQSSTSGTKASIAAAAGVTIDVKGAIIKDTNASGGANFTANNSVDNGNNTGWTFPAYSGQNLYWVGGSGNWNDKAHWSQISGGAGGYCVPGPKDNTFFDGGSGFTSSNAIVKVDNISYTHNITFDGSSVAPTLTESGLQTLNIYGSSVWQSGMPAINISYIYYRNTGEAKTITSNGVKTGNRNVYLEETNSISLSDAFSVELFLYHQAGTFRTNGHDLTIGYSFEVSLTSSPKTIILGSSQVYMTATGARFNTNQANITLNAGTSHIHFPNMSSFQSSEGILPYQGQTFYNVSFENSNGGGSLGGNQTGTVYFNRVEFKGNGNIYQNNQFKELVFNAGKTYTLQADKTQTTQSWILGGTPCAVTFVQNSTTGLRANINVTGGNTNFNFGNLKEINASGQTLHFGAQSTIAGQNNNNITYDPYNPGAFAGLGADWLCHTVDDADSSTYLIPTDAFYGNSRTTYSWYKLNDSNYNPATVLGTDNTIDIRNFGFGTYKVEVTYTDGASITCVVSDEINILQRTVAPTASSLVCSKANNTLADITVNGTNPKWYADNTTTTELPSNTAITNGATYYTSQTLNNCESTRTAVTISIVLCNKAVMVNPNLRVRTK